MRYFLLFFFAAVVGVVLIAGPQGKRSPNRPFEIFPDMDHQPKVKAQSPSRFFADGVGPRLPVAGTVPMGYDFPAAPNDLARIAGAENPTPRVSHPGLSFGNDPSYLATGKMGDRWGDGIPVEVNARLMDLGRDKFGIYCAVCHGVTGHGNGVTSKYGWNGIANYHDERIVAQPDGELYNTITHGKNTMYGYGANLSVTDRWAIVAYVRALQKAQRGTVADLTPEQRATLPAP